LQRPDPQFVTEFRQQALELVNETGRFDPHAHRPLQIPLQRMCSIALAIQTLLEKKLSRFVVGPGNLLIACVKTTSNY
jgi:hypothetical protein